MLRGKNRPDSSQIPMDSAMGRAPWRGVALAIALPCAALGVQWALWPWISPYVWVLFFPAVFFSARLAGFWGGMLSAALSAAIVWYTFMPPQFTWLGKNPSSLYSMSLFLLMGYLFSESQQRLRDSILRAQAALAEAEAANAKLSDLLDHAPLAYQSLDIQGRFIDMNPQLCALLGYPREELLGKAFDEVWQDDVKPCFPGEFAKFQRDSQISNELRLLRKDGQPVTVILEGRIQRDPQGRFVRTHCILTNITERKRMEDALKASEEEFRQLAEAMPQIVWATRPDGWNVYHNHQWMAYTGMSAEDSQGHGWSQAVHPDDRERAVQAWGEAVERHGPYAIEFRLRRADGAYHWWLIRGVPVLDAAGKLLKWFGTCTDIHGLKAREAEINASEARRRFALETLGAGEWELDLATRAAVRSPIHDQIFGYPSPLPEWTYPMFLEHVLPEDRARVDRLFQQAVADGATWDFECRIIRADGALRWIHARGHSRAAFPTKAPPWSAS